jgi:glycosyltransferase involved in cell wall biosynthesis
MAGDRKRIGILFNTSTGWLGGIYYLINLIHTLDFLPEEKKPEIILFYSPGLKAFVDDLGYPYLIKREWKFISPSRGYIGSFVCRRNLFIDKILRDFDLDGVYPLFDFPVPADRSPYRTRIVAWYADLQHKYYPEYFSGRQRLLREARIRFLLKNAGDLVVSSQDVANDFARFYTIRKGMKIHIYRFVSVMDDLTGMEINEVRQKYGLPEEYYVISNQFHRHKNHQVLLECLALCKGSGIRPHLAITGKFPDDDQSPYIRGLFSLVEKHGLNDQVTFLGVIPRRDQLLLIRHSKAIIQPSFFEGWSTFIEDAISLQVPVIASNLPVNIEQLGDKGVYFDPKKPEELADILKNHPGRNMDDLIYEEYEIRMKRAAGVFMSIFS